jgi:hypothetical protein
VSASQKEWQIHHTRDEQLNQIRSEMSQQRQTIQARLESLIHGQTVDSPFTAGMQAIEADGRSTTITDPSQSGASDRKDVHSTGTATPPSTTLASASNTYSPSVIAARDPATTFHRSQFTQTIEPELQATYAPARQVGSSGFARNDHYGWSNLNPQVPLSTRPQADSTSHPLNPYLCRGSCVQDGIEWCICCLGANG